MKPRLQWETDGWLQFLVDLEVLSSAQKGRWRDICTIRRVLTWLQLSWGCWDLIPWAGGRELEAKSLWGQKVVHIFNGVAAAAAAVQVLRK